MNTIYTDALIHDSPKSGTRVSHHVSRAPKKPLEPEYSRISPESEPSMVSAWCDNFTVHTPSSKVTEREEAVNGRAYKAMQSDSLDLDSVRRKLEFDDCHVEGRSFVNVNIGERNGYKNIMKLR